MAAAQHKAILKQYHPLLPFLAPVHGFHPALYELAFILGLAEGPDIFSVVVVPLIGCARTLIRTISRCRVKARVHLLPMARLKKCIHGGKLVHA